jgi:hypothetical protein
MEDEDSPEREIAGKKLTKTFYVRGFGTTKGERKNIWGRVGVR